MLEQPDQTERLTVVDDDSASQLAQAAHQLLGLERVLAGLLNDFDDFSDALSDAASLRANIDTDNHPANVMESYVARGWTIDADGHWHEPSAGNGL